MPGISRNNRPSSPLREGPPPLKRRCSDKSITKVLIESLREKRNKDIDIDVHFIIEEDNEQKKIGAHKLVLTSLSNIFESVLTNQEVCEILLQLPENGNVTFEVAQAFVKALYCEDLLPSLQFDDMVKVALLAQQFEIDVLVRMCVKMLGKKVTEENCIEVMESHSLGGVFQPVKEAAATYLKGCIAKLINSSLSWPSKVWEIVLEFEWENTLCSDSPTVKVEFIKESVLFSSLLRWRQEDETRDLQFRKLLKRIRFPLMTEEEITTVVEPSNVLTAIGLQDICSFIKGNCEKTINFSYRPRCYNLANDESNLSKLISSAKSWDYIFLPEGTYKCSLKFPVETLKNVTIRGAGKEKTRIICDQDEGALFQASLDNSTICDLSFSSQSETYGCALFNGDRICIKNVVFQNASVILKGKKFLVDNLSVVFPPGQANLSSVSGDFTESIFSNLTFCNSVSGIVIKSESCFNNWNNLTFENVLTGITIHDASNNNLKDIRYKHEAPVKNRRAVVIIAGKQIEVCSLSCEFREITDDSFTINVRGLPNLNLSPLTTKPSENNVFKNVRNGNILLNGRNNRVEDFKSEGGFIADNSVGTVLINCEVEKLIVKEKAEPEIKNCTCKKILFTAKLNAQLATPR